MKTLRLVLSFALLCGLTTGLHAQTTGDIAGKVSVAGEKGLEGVGVAAFGPSLQGSRVTITDDQGRYRLTLLPPGQYNVTFNLQNFATETRSDLTVFLDRVTTLDLVMRPTLEEQIRVVGEAVVDTTTTSVTTNLNTRAIETLPTGRNYSSIVQVVPGISSDNNSENTGQTHVTVYGSAGNENTYYIDGVNTTGVEYGFQGKELNFEFIKEIDVKAGGYEAEYGRSTGGIINVITKSGGNEFRGDFFGYFDSDSLQSGAESTVSTAGILEGFERADFGADLGGYIVKDKLWFFGAFDRVSNTISSQLPSGPQAGDVVDSESTRVLGAFKLTYKMADNQTLIFTYFQDPREDTGAINDPNHSLNGDPLTYTGKQDFGGRDYALRYEAVYGSNWLLTAQVSRHGEENSVGPASAAGDIVQERDVANNFFQTGGFGLIQDKEFTRDTIGASATRFLGNHEIKFGVEYEEQEADVIKRMSGGQQVDMFANTVNPGMPIYRHFYWTTATAALTDPGGPAISQLDATTKHEDTSLYVQDRWKLRPNLTLNYGIRWDRQEIISSRGVREIDLNGDFSPRVGLIWDPSRTHNSKVYGSFGRFYEKIPMDLVIRSFSSERQPRIVNYDPVSTVPDAAAESDFMTASQILGGFNSVPDPDLKGQYVRESILGWEREMRPNLALGVKAIHRSYGEVIEDFLCDTLGTYCIGNPGRGLMENSIGLDYVSIFPAPTAERRYRGIQVDVTKRFSNNWQGLASYVLSKLDGNFDGGYAPFTNVGADPNISAAWDYYDFFTDGADLTRITNTGNLSNDRRHQLKFSGVYFTPFKMSVGVAGYWRSGTPLTRYGYSDAYGRYEFFLDKRGSEGRNPDTYEVDVHLGYPLKTGRVTVNFMVDIFSLLDAQRPILLDQRWGFAEADNASPTPVNPDYGEPILRTPPRTIRMGLRVSY